MAGTSDRTGVGGEDDGPLWGLRFGSVAVTVQGEMLQRLAIAFFMPFLQ